MRELVVGTRKSKLALIQTNEVIKQLREAGVDHPIQIKEMDTAGDQNVHVSLPKLGRGVFLEEIERELIDEKIDFAVHSLKDIPSELPNGLTIASIPEREDYRDALLHKDGLNLAELPAGSVVGTSSVRRVAQLKKKRPDIETNWIRGPIDSRINQMLTGKFDAIVLAMAGLNRLAIGKDLITEKLDAENFLPAMGQGALAIECRSSDLEVVGILGKINDDNSRKSAMAERKFSSHFEEGEHAPIGAYAYVEDGLIHLHGMVLNSTGETIVEHKASGTKVDTVAREAAETLIKQGALAIIAKANEELEKSAQ